MPRIYTDTLQSGSEIVTRVIPDVVRVSTSAGQDVESLPREVTCRRGRVPGTRRQYALARIVGPVRDLTAAECRALADALTAAAAVLDGTA